MPRSSFRLRAWLALLLLCAAGAAAWPLVSGAGDLRLLAGLVFAGLLALAAWAGSIALARPVEELAEHARAVVRSQVRSGGEIAEIERALELATEQARLETERAANTRLHTASLLSGMAEGVVAVDLQERVLFMNRSAANLLGLDAELPEGARLWESLRFPALERALRGSIDGIPQEPLDAPSPQPDGRTLSISVHAVRSQHGFQGAVALLLDVTAVRKVEQMRIDFVANVSHELRTPLAAVLGALETVADAQTDAATTTRFLEIAQRNASRLQAIVSDLLELSSIESQASRMPLEPMGIGSPLRSAAAALAGAAESKGVALVVEPVPADLPPISGNHGRLERVFTNLIENAIKYTQKGGHVRARARLAGRALEVEIEDDGIGIPAAHLPRVFERFYRVDRSRSREMGGTGLGLAIVKHVVRAHGGNVEVESEEGRGALFRVRLPVLAGEAAARRSAG
ncbi:MAG: PAS domain-containing protein [Planctomycetes bacterium]|nr:PAS domain-containing protein [Planctomycetota bacterium]